MQRHVKLCLKLNARHSPHTVLSILLRPIVVQPSGASIIQNNEPNDWTPCVEVLLLDRGLPYCHRSTSSLEDLCTRPQSLSLLSLSSSRHGRLIVGEIAGIDEKWRCRHWNLSSRVVRSVQLIYRESFCTRSVNDIPWQRDDYRLSEVEDSSIFYLHRISHKIF